MKKTEKGFTPAHILIVVLVLAIVGVVGWRVYDSNKTKDVSDSSKLTTAKSTTTGSQTANIVPLYDTKGTYTKATLVGDNLIVREWNANGAPG